MVFCYLFSQNEWMFKFFNYLEECIELIQSANPRTIIFLVGINLDEEDNKIQDAVIRYGVEEGLVPIGFHFSCDQISYD